ncbi:MAG: two-component system response regulator [Deltaproteobacteria bacterium RIFOXYD12_FULL_55_16]|nr:MAG: two-component system response regulator [Deltaproteobacteria bacterium RIFOXYD12_FULL_55_16]
MGEIIGQPCYKVSHHLDLPCYLDGEDCPVKHVFDTGEPRTTIHTHYDVTGQRIYVKNKAFALQKNDLGEVQTVIEIVVDITAKNHREAEIHHLAFYDPLTSLPNRRLLLDRLEQAFITGARTGYYGAVLFLDLDHFKTLNDTRGHDVGDLLLVEMAGRLQAAVREGDTVSRQGGDEFVVLLKNLSKAERVAITQAGHVAEKIRTDLGQPFRLAGHEQQITASIGICLFCGHDTTVEELFKRADTAMYQAKNTGRNAVRFFDPAMQAALEASSALETDLRQAISKRQLQLHYQPQADSTGKIIGAEALLRWTHPERGPMSPAAFIPLAEESGLILPISHWVLEEACAQLKAWADLPAASAIRLAVNVSARQFRQADFVKEVQQIIAASGADPTRLKLELTESLVLADIADSIAKMQELGAMGIGFSMDDFGTGYSSLSQFQHLPLEQLKIDLSFVHDLGIGPQDAEIIETIIAMGRILGFHVIAEGVETRAQMDFLLHSGCEAYQGYLFSQPVTAPDFELLLAAGVMERKG